MATTFKPLVIRSERKQDGTYNVKIRVTHNRKNKRVATNLFVESKHLVRATLEIKSQDILDACNDIITGWRKKVDKLGMGASDLTVEEIVKYILAEDDQIEIRIIPKEDTKFGFTLDFIEFGRKVADSKSDGTAGNYHTALNCLTRFLVAEKKGADGYKPLTTVNEEIKVYLDISQVTAKFLERFEEYITSEPVQNPKRKNKESVQEKKKKGRAVSSYMENLRHIHNRAKWEYNDEDLGIIRIPLSPFAKYKVKKAPAPKPRPISTETIQNIINLADELRKDGPPGAVTRRDLARDCFLISFGLAGMNAADLYDCEPGDLDKKQKVLTYGRKKTRTRRDDGAIMKIRIEPCIWPLVDKYLSDGGAKLFKFADLYSSADGFNVALRHGVGKIQKAVDAPPFVFYSARYSWATIGRSDEIGIDKYTIHEGLNHVDEKMRVTDGYIQKDYRPIWKANAEILGLFDWSAVLEREKGRATS
jgi:integrase